MLAAIAETKHILNNRNSIYLQTINKPRNTDCRNSSKLQSVVRHAMRVILLAIVLFGLASCQEGSTVSAATGDTTSTKTPEQDVQPTTFKTAAQQIGFDVPSDKDSFVLRLWVTSMVKPNRVIELRKFAGQWQGKQFDYYEESDGRLFYKQVKQKDTTLAPAIIDSLHQIDFLQLVSQDQIQGFSDNVADGQTFHMEVFMPFRYKLLRYHCPESYYSKESSNKGFVDILMLLDKHFHFYMPLCKWQ